MAVYYLTIVLVCFLCYYAEDMDWPETDKLNEIVIKHTSNAGIIYACVILLLIFVAGLRYKVGMDYSAYYKHFENYLNTLPNAIRELDEPGYGILVWIATRFYYDGAAAIFIGSLVTVLLPLIVIYKYSDYLLMPTFLYITLGCWSGSFNGVRQYLAAAVLFCGYRYLREQNLIMYCIVVFIAFLFHRSALVFLLLYFVVYRDINIRNVLILFISASILLLFYENVFSIADFIMDAHYSLDDAYTSTVVNRLRILAACVPTVVFWGLYYGENTSEAEKFSLNIVALRSAISILAMNSALLYRINIYTSFFTTIAITELLKGLSEKNKRIVTFVLVIMYLVMWWYEIYNSRSMNPFRWIWER